MFRSHLFGIYSPKNKDLRTLAGCGGGGPASGGGAGTGSKEEVGFTESDEEVSDLGLCTKYEDCISSCCDEKNGVIFLACMCAGRYLHIWLTHSDAPVPTAIR
jgi:hypothetical protein